MVVGFLLLGATPQAQDLLIPLVDSAWYWVLLFFVLHFLFWAMPVHYAARIVLAHDARLYDYGGKYPSPYFRLARTMDFAAAWRLDVPPRSMSTYSANSNLPNLPNIRDHGVTDLLSHSLHYFMLWCVVGLIVFLFYAVYRTKFSAYGPGGRWTEKLHGVRPPAARSARCRQESIR